MCPSIVTTVVEHTFLAPQFHKRGPCKGEKGGEKGEEKEATKLRKLIPNQLSHFCCRSRCFVYGRKKEEEGGGEENKSSVGRAQIPLIYLF